MGISGKWDEVFIYIEIILVREIDDKFKNYINYDLKLGNDEVCEGLRGEGVDVDEECLFFL